MLFGFNEGFGDLELHANSLKCRAGDGYSGVESVFCTQAPSAGLQIDKHETDGQFLCFLV